MKCSVCSHPRRKAIDEALANATPRRALASRFGLAHATVGRHRAHVAALLARAQEAREKVEEAHGGSLLARVHELAAEAARIGRKADRHGNPGAAIAAIREQVRIADLIARMTGALKEPPARPETQTNYILVFEGGRPTTRPASVETQLVEPEKKP